MPRFPKEDDFSIREQFGFFNTQDKEAQTTASITQGSLPTVAEQDPRQAEDLHFQLLTFESDRL